jgi:hypothetical protein
VYGHSTVPLLFADCFYLPSTVASGFLLMPANLHDLGENLVLDAALGSRDMDVGLYNDGTDALADGATYSDITTEPTGSAYAVQTAAGGTVATNSGTTEIDLGSLSFDTSDSAQSVDALYVRDSSTGDLIFTNALDSSYDLSSIDTLDLSNIGLTLD